MTTDPTDESGSDHQSPIDTEASEWQPVVYRSFEHEGWEELTYEIIAAIATATEVEATTVTPPLFESVDVFALEKLFFGHSSKTSHDCTGRVQFRYCGLRVTVTSDGRITVAAPSRDAAFE